MLMDHDGLGPLSIDESGASWSRETQGEGRDADTEYKVPGRRNSDRGGCTARPRQLYLDLGHLED